MPRRKLLGILFLCLAAASTVAGISVASQGMKLTDPSGLGLSEHVGAFLPAVVCLIVGLSFLKVKEE